MKLGDLVFFKGKGFVSKVISLLTNSPYTHVAIAVSDTEILEADVFIKSRIRTLNKEDVYCVMRYENLTEQQLNFIKNECYNSIGISYDYFQVFLWSLRLIFKYKKGVVNNANKEYCSELVDRIYYEAGVVLLPNALEGDCTPAQLLDSPLLTKIQN